MGLFNPAWQSKDPKQRMIGVGRLTDPDKLYKAIINEFDEEIKKVGILRLNAIGANNHMYNICADFFIDDDCICTACGEELHDFHHDPDYNPEDYELWKNFCPHMRAHAITVAP